MHIQMTRLYEAAETLKGITGQSDVARALNASPQTVNNWEARGMSKSGMLTAQAVIGCSATWLATGEGSMALELGPMPAGEYRRVEIVPSDDPRLVQVPLTALRLSAGITGFRPDPEHDEGLTISVERSWVERNGYYASSLVAIKVKGESMEPTLYHGDTVVINTADTKMVDGVVYAINYEGEAVVKRLERELGQWWLKSDNKETFPRKMCRNGECIIVGRVVRKETDRI
jgi:phage repressor protein C with HTH and peptisase S24 domain